MSPPKELNITSLYLCCFDERVIANALCNIKKGILITLNSCYASFIVFFLKLVKILDFHFRVDSVTIICINFIIFILLFASILLLYFYYLHQFYYSIFSDCINFITLFLLFVSVLSFYYFYQF